MAQPKSKDLKKLQKDRAKSERKILRIGIIQSGKIIEERLLRKREPVTIGESQRNTFVLSGTPLPPRFPIFELRGNQYYLTIAEWMDIRISLGKEVFDLNRLKQQKLVKKVGFVDYRPPNSNRSKKVPVYQIALNDRSRGKISLGDTTLLFQFVTPPPLPEQSQMPAFIRSSWLSNIDWFYFSILSASFILHLGLIQWFRAIGPLPAVSLTMIEDRFAREVAPPPPEPKPKPKVQTKEDDKGKKGKGDKKGGKKVRKKRGGKKRKGGGKKLSAAERARIEAERRRARQEAAARRLAQLGLIGTTGSSGSGAVADVIGEGVYTGDLDKALQNADGVAVGGGGDGLRGARRRGGGGGGKLSLKERLTGPAGDGGPVGGTHGRRTVKIKASIKLENIEPPSEGNLDVGSLMRKIRIYQTRFKYCYERELKKNPNLRGKIVITLTIAPNGKVSDSEIEDNTMNNDRVANCLISNLKRMRFPKPEGGEEAVVKIPFFFAPSG